MRARNCKGRVRGACHPKAKVPDSDVEMIIFLHDEHGIGYKALAKKFELSRQTVWNFCNGRTRAKLG
jgi:DNA invertase Pin-like site-specific DNA recombinase